MLENISMRTRLRITYVTVTACIISVVVLIPTLGYHIYQHGFNLDDINIYIPLIGIVFAMTGMRMGCQDIHRLKKYINTYVINKKETKMKEIITNILLVMFFVLVTSEYALPCDLTDNEQQSYDFICPHGDAVIEFKDGHTEDVACVNYDPEERLWILMYAESYQDVIYCTDVKVKRFSPSDVKVHTMDGELTVEQAEADLKVNDPLVSSIIKK